MAATATAITTATATRGANSTSKKSVSNVRIAIAKAAPKNPVVLFAGVQSSGSQTTHDVTLLNLLTLEAGPCRGVARAGDHPHKRGGESAEH